MIRAITTRFLQIALMALTLAFATAARADDRGLLQGFIEDNLSTAGRQVRIEGFKGALSSEASLDLLTIADDDGIWLTLKDVKLNWSRLALLSGRLQVTKLTAGEIDLPRLPKSQPGPDIPDAESTGFSLPELPVSVNIDEVAADKIVLGKPILGEEVSLSVKGSLQLAGGEGNAKLDIVRLDRKSDKVTLDASYANADRKLGIDLDVTEAEDGLVSTLMGIPGTPSIKLTVKGDAPLDDFTADITLDTDGERRIGGTVTVEASAPDPETPDAPAPLKFAADIGGDIAPVFAPEYRAFFGRNVALKVRGSKPADGGLNLDTLSVQAAALKLDGSLQMGTEGWPQSFDLTGRLASADGAPVLLPLSGEKTTLSRADLSLTYDRATGDGWKLSLDATGLERADLTLKSVQVTGGGTISKGEGGGPGHADGALDLSADGIAPRDPGLKTALGDALRGKLVFDWTQGKPFRLTQLTLTGDDYDLDGSAEITGLGKPAAPRLSASVALNAADLSRFAGLAGQPLKGAGQVQIDAATTPMDGTMEVTVNGTAQDLAIGQPRLDPLLKGRTVLDVAARRDKTGTYLDKLHVTSPATDLTASGAWKTGASSGKLALAVKDAALVAPGLNGPAKLKATADQAGDTWTIAANASGPGGATMTANGKVNVKDGKPGRFGGSASVIASDFAPYSALAGRDLGGAASVVVNAEGDIATLSGQARMVVEGQDLAVGIAPADRILRGKSSAEIDAQRSADGALTLSRGTLTTPTVDASAEGFMAADGSGQAKLDVKGDNLALGIPQADRLLSGKSSLQAEVTRKGDGTIVIKRADLETPQAQASASGTLGTDGSSSAKFDARLANVALFAPGIPGPATAKGTISGDGDGYVIDTDATGPAGIAASIKGRVGGDGNLNLDVTGKAPLALADLFISPRSLAGLAQFDLRVNGPPALSSVTGTITTQGAALSLPKVKLALQGINATIRLAGGAAQIDIGAGVNTGGRLSASGRIGLAAPYQADITVQLQQIGITDPSLYTTTANGRITFNGPAAGGANIAGRIDLGEVDVQVPNGAISSGTDLPGLKHVNEPAPVHRTRAFADLLGNGGDGGPGTDSSGPSYGLDVQVNALNRIFIRGRGLDAELGGQLHLRGTTANVIPEGQFDLIRGRLDILGKRLDLTEGSLKMEGSFVPYLHLVAQTTSGDVVVIIIIDGPATEPEITFSSQPELPQDQVLSQLIFGRDISEISAFQALQLASAVATLAGKGGGGIVGKLRNSFGLDNLDVTSEGDTTEVRAGKYLSKNLYSEVEVGSDGTTQINLNLQISKHIKAKGSFGADGNSGLGVFYEKDY